MRVTILGAGLAGFAVADALNELAPQFDKSVHPDDGQPSDDKLQNALLLSMVTADKADRYHKPMLSSAFGQGKTAQNLVRVDGQTSAQNANLALYAKHTAYALSDNAVCTKTEDGCEHRHTFDKLILAMGASPVVPTALQGFVNLFDINHLDNFEKLRHHLTNKENPVIVIVGAGMVGVELCEDLRNFKPNATIYLINSHNYPLPFLLKDDIKKDNPLFDVAQVLLDKLQNKLTINYQAKTQIVSFDNHRIMTNDGVWLDCDALVLATGLQVNKALIDNIVPCDDRLGVAVKEHNLQSIDNPNVYAIGDCMNIDGQTSRFVAPLKIQARAIALDILGQTGDYKHTPPMIRLKNKAFSFVVNGKISDEKWVKETENDNELVLTQPSGAKLQLRW